MGIQRTNFSSWDEDKKHREKLRKKLEKINGLRALYMTHAVRLIESKKQVTYLRDLRRRIRSAENQYKAMKI